MTVRLRIGTRGSTLALAQAGGVGRALGRLGFSVTIVAIETRGDRDKDAPLAELGAGAFANELERALLAEEIDVAVHSYKDLPSRGVPELVIAAVPAREDAADALVARAAAHDASAGALPLVEGARVGTSSTRRQALVRLLRPDLRVVPLRGNVPTRVARVRDGELDAIVVACAGLRRLDRAAARDAASRLDRRGLVERRLDPARFVPAPSQGALALQAVASRHDVVRAVAALDDHATRAPVSAERRLLELVEGDCTVPFGAYCRSVAPAGGPKGKARERLELRAFLLRGGRARTACERGSDPLRLAQRVSEALGEEATGA